MVPSSFPTIVKIITGASHENDNQTTLMPKLKSKTLEVKFFQIKSIKLIFDWNRYFPTRECIQLKITHYGIITIKALERSCDFKIFIVNFKTSSPGFIIG